MPTPATPLEQALKQSWTYADYRQHLTDLLAQGRTTGPTQTPFYLEIAALNQARMDRLDKRPRLSEQLLELGSQLQRDYLMLVLTEGWCGDAAQTLPVMNWLAEHSPRLTLNVALRDEHPALIDQYLVNGGRSIPKLLFIEPSTRAVLADWGPRPLVAQAIAQQYLRSPEESRDYEAYNKRLHRWYARDKTRSTQAELHALLHYLDGNGAVDTKG